jgi:hypothetical protein
LSEKISRVGKVRSNSYGSLMKIVKYNNAKDIWVEFLEHGNQLQATWQNFINGEVKNPYDKSILSVGYIGEGTYKAGINNKHTPQYIAWNNMLKRCYDPKFHKRSPTYKDCSVIEEWHNFQTFAKWHDDHYYEIEGERMQLDKDILIIGNKVYSPETCVFVPARINSLFLRADGIRGNLYLGVSLCKRSNNYTAYCNNGKGNRKHLGSYKTPEDAFFAYKTHKEELIKQIAEELSGKIPLKLYNAMMNYQVEIDD